MPWAVLCQHPEGGIRQGRVVQAQAAERSQAAQSAEEARAGVRRLPLAEGAGQAQIAQVGRGAGRHAARGGRQQAGHLRHAQARVLHGQHLQV